MNILDKEYNGWITYCEMFLKERSMKEQRDFFIKAYARDHLKVKKVHEFIRNENYWKNTLGLIHILEGDI